MTNQGLIFNIYKQLIQFNIKKQPKFLKNEQKNGTDVLPKRNEDSQQPHEKMFNAAHYQGNEHQNHNEVSPHTCQNGHQQKEH